MNPAALFTGKYQIYIVCKPKRVVKNGSFLFISYNFGGIVGIIF